MPSGSAMHLTESNRLAMLCRFLVRWGHILGSNTNNSCADTFDPGAIRTTQWNHDVVSWI